MVPFGFIPAKYRPFAYAMGIGAGASLFAAFWTWLKNRGLSLPSIPSPVAPQTSIAPSPEIKVTPQQAANHQWARAIVRNALRELLGRDPSLGEMQYGQAIGSLETGYGKGWKKPPQKCIDAGMPIDYAGAAASNNWGAVQATSAAQPGFDWCDSKSDGGVYKQRFRSYPTPEEGAKDALRNVFTGSRKIVVEAVTGPGATVWRASFAMRRQRYYGSFCPQAVKQYGARVGSLKSWQEPETDEGTLACEKEAVKLHAELCYRIIGQIAVSNSENIAIPLGTYEDALAWYRKKAGIAA